MARPRAHADRRAAPRPAAKPAAGSRWALALIPLAVVAAAVFLFNSGAVSTGPKPLAGAGNVVAEHTVHEFGTVNLHGGLINAKFPLAVDAPVDAVDLTTS